MRVLYALRQIKICIFYHYNQNLTFLIYPFLLQFFFNVFYEKLEKLVFNSTQILSLIENIENKIE